MLRPSMRSYSGVETKKPEMQASAASVRKMAARQNNNFDGVTVNHRQVVKRTSSGRAG